MSRRSGSVAVAVKAEQLPVHGDWLPIAAQHRGGVDFADGDGDRLAVGEAPSLTTTSKV